MTVDELRAACEDAIAHPERSRPDKPLVTLVAVSKAPLGRRLRGRLLCENRNGQRVYHYRADRVLALLKKEGLIKP